VRGRADWRIRSAGAGLFVPACAIALAGAILAPGAARAFDRHEVWISASGNWARLAPPGGTDRPHVDGGGGGARVMVALSDAFGLALEGTATWYRGFTPLPVSSPEENGSGEGGAEEKAATPGEPTSGIACRDLALTLVYAIDVFALVPQIALGLAVARLAETRGGAALVAWDLALRFEIGVDYRPARRFALGLWGAFDTVLLGASPWVGRSALSLRFTVPLGGG